MQMSIGNADRGSVYGNIDKNADKSGDCEGKGISATIHIAADRLNSNLGIMTSGIGCRWRR